MKRNKRARRPAAATRYTCCVAMYYMPGLDETDIVRMTATVVDLKTDALVDQREFWSEDDMEAAVEGAVDLALRYGAVIYSLPEAVPLERCACGCDEYTVRTIQRRDFAVIQHDQVCPARVAP